MAGDSSQSTFLVGQTARLEAEFTLSDVPTDPTTVSVTIGDAAGLPVTYVFGVDGQVVNSAVGHYYVDFKADAPGTWLVSWVGTGAVETLIEYQFDVADSAHPWATPHYAPVYASLSQFKAALRIKLNDDVDDFSLMAALRAASRKIEQDTGRWFYARTQTRYFSPYRADWLDVPDLLAVTSVKFDTNGDGIYETTLSATQDYWLDPVNAPLDGRPYRRLVMNTSRGRYVLPVWDRTVEIVGSWGYCATGAVPEEITDACILRATAEWKGPTQSSDGMIENSMGGGVTSIKPDKRYLDLISTFRRKALFA